MLYFKTDELCEFVCVSVCVWEGYIPAGSIGQCSNANQMDLSEHVPLSYLWLNTGQTNEVRDAYELTYDTWFTISLQSNSTLWTSLNL